MVTLRLLQINNLSLEGKFLPDELKWLQWQGCPLECIPLDTLPRELAVLDLSNAEKIKSLRGLESHNKVHALAILCIIQSQMNKLWRLHLQPFSQLFLLVNRDIC